MSEIQLLKEDYDEDQRGMASLVLQYLVPDFTTVQTYLRGEAYGSLHPAGRSSIIDEAGRRILTLRFKGIVSENGEHVYSLQPGFERRPIEEHPQINELMTKYGGSVNPSTGRVEFLSPTVPPDAGSGGGIGGNDGSTTDQPNPMFGRRDFLRMTGTLEESYVANGVPGDIFEQLNQTQDGAPGGYPTPPGYTWLCVAPKVDQHGQNVVVGKRLKLIPNSEAPSALNPLFVK